MEIGGGQRRPQQRMSQPYGGGMTGQQRIFVPGDTMSLAVFGNQPKRPVPGSTRTTWDQTPFGTHSPMVMAYNSEGIAKVELVPIRMQVYFYRWGSGPNEFWLWAASCNNMIKLANDYSQPRTQQVRMAPQQYCAPVRPLIMREQYCPPPRRQQILICPPIPQRQPWCPPQSYGYRR